MDVDFLKQLDEQISNVGTSECWKREIAGRVIWFSPIPGDSQAKVNDTLANADLGANTIFETKRITIAHAIVGIDSLDLRPWRFAGSVFPISDPRLGKEVKVDLAGYIKAKMSTWGGEFIDRAFEVFVDLMESHKKDSLKNVTFENAKDPLTELAEIEARAAELRQQLGMPNLIEAPASGDEDSLGEKLESDKTPVRSSPKEASSIPDPPIPDVEFNPFATVAKDPLPQPKIQHTQSQEAVQNYSPPPISTPSPTPTITVPVPVPPPAARAPATVPYTRTRQPSKAYSQVPAVGREGSTPDRPFQATPSVPSEVIEAPASKVVVPPPTVDKAVGNVNPRFSRPTR